MDPSNVQTGAEYAAGCALFVVAIFAAPYLLGFLAAVLNRLRGDFFRNPWR